MPRLSDGLHYGVSADNIKQILQNDSDEAASAFILGFRLEISHPEQLLPFMIVVSCPDKNGQPANDEAEPTGFMVREVFEGKAGWSEGDLNTFRDWTENTVKPRLDNVWEEVHQMILHHPVWGSKFWSED